METLTALETRSRSRSKNPFLRSSCDRESCAHATEGHIHDKRKSPVKRSPLVQTIIEEVIESTRPADNRIQKSFNMMTSDYSSGDTSPETARIQTAVKRTTTTISHTKTVLNDAAKSYDTFSRQKIHNSMSKSKEASQNEINSVYEEQSMTTSTPVSYGAKKHIFSSPTNGNLSGHIGYQVYKEAGEYWNKFPKTDYTYSHLSPDRRELAPGIIAMPNMSRKSLEKHHQRVDFMVQQNPSQASYIRERYQATRHTTDTAPVLQQDVYYDSQDEVDESDFKMYQANKRYYTSSYTNSAVTSTKSKYQESLITRILSSIVTVFYQLITVFSGSEQNSYHTRIDQKAGFFRGFGSAILSLFLGVIHYIYLLISSVLYLDTWLLRSSFPESQNKKRFLLFLLIWLPLLLLAAWYLLDEKERTSLVTRLQNTLPVSFISLRGILPSKWSEAFKFNFEFLEPSSKFLLNRYKYESATNNFHESLTIEQYNKLINHIDAYVQQSIEDKLSTERTKLYKSEGKISKELSILIANVVQDNLMATVEAQTKQPTAPSIIQQYELNDDDIQRIADTVRLQLISFNGNSGKFTFTQENLEEISKLIKYNIEINNKSFNILEKVDINELLFKLLQSPKLDEYINKRIMESSDIHLLHKQQAIMTELAKEIADIKAQLFGNLNENKKNHLYIDLIKANLDKLAGRFDFAEADINKKISTLTSDIDAKIASFSEKQFTLISRQIKLSLLEVLGYKNGQSVDEVDLKNWIRNLFVAKDYLEERLAALNLKLNLTLKSEIDQAGVIFIKDITEKLKIEMLKIIESQPASASIASGSQLFNDDEVRRIVQGVLAVYDADKTGLVDYALESAGGQVLSTRCTESYQTKTAQISIFGIPLWYPSNTPRIAISPAVQPGECWAFQGFPGFLVLKLNAMVFVNGVTIEHIPKSLTPNGKIDSAPKRFSVWGLNDENDPNPILFGEYEYIDKNVSLQYFAVQNKDINRPFDIVELRIESNHGHPGYTCLYRFRVHGSPNQR